MAYTDEQIQLVCNKAADVMKDLLKQYGFKNPNEFTSLGFKVSLDGDNYKVTIH